MLFLSRPTRAPGLKSLILLILYSLPSVESISISLIEKQSLAAEAAQAEVLKIITIAVDNAAILIVFLFVGSTARGDRTHLVDVHKTSGCNQLTLSGLAFRLAGKNSSMLNLCCQALD